MKAFTNWTNEDFTYSWGGKLATFTPGQTVEMEDGIAEHFAKHLAVRELNKDGKATEETAVLDLMRNCFIIKQTPVINEEIEHVITENDLELNPELVDKVEVGETVTIPKEVKKAKAKANF